MIVWTEDYSVGHDLVDAQHRELIDIINQLDAIATDHSIQAYEQFHIQLHRLAEYANKHFEFEELVMTSKNCPNLAEHTQEHERYREHMCDVLYEACQGMSDRRRLCDWLLLWWNNHILVDDKNCLLT